MVAGRSRILRADGARGVARGRTAARESLLPSPAAALDGSRGVPVGRGADGGAAGPASARPRRAQLEAVPLPVPRRGRRARKARLAYVRCLEQRDRQSQEAIRSTFLAEARSKLRWSDEEARAILGRPIPHILPLHLGAIDADAMDALLTDYERMGVRWISLDEALADPCMRTIQRYRTARTFCSSSRSRSTGRAHLNSGPRTPC